MFALLFPLAQADDPYAAFTKTKAMTAADEFNIGRTYSTSRAWLTGIWNNPDQQVRVERMVREIVAASDRPDMVMTVTLLDTAEINATAFPGGFLLVNRGTLEKMKDPELAFILGHEIAHAELRHGANALNLAAAARTVSQLAASQAAGDRESAIRQADDLRKLSAGFTRQQELEADVYGMLYTVRAGWSAQASIDSMTQLKASFGGMEAPPWMQVYADHPTFDQRIRELELGRGTIERTARRFDAGVVLLQSGRGAEAALAFQEFLTLFPKSSAAWANLGACWLLQVPGPAPWEEILPIHTTSGVTVRADTTAARERAQEAVSHALELDPYDPIALGLYGLLALRSGDPASAWELLDRADELAPESPILLLDRGNAAAELGSDKDALADWAAAVALDPGMIEAHVNRALLLERNKKTRKAAIEAWIQVGQFDGWDTEAREHLEALGAKPKALAQLPPPPPVEAILVGESPLSALRSLSEFEGALGAPVDDQLYGQETRVLGWPGLVVTTQDDRVLSVTVRSPGPWRTSSGIGIGSSLAEATATFGAHSDDVRIGGVCVRTWPRIGLTLSFIDDKVSRITLMPPEAM